MQVFLTHFSESHILQHTILYILPITYLSSESLMTKIVISSEVSGVIALHAAVQSMEESVSASDSIMSDMQDGSMPAAPSVIMITVSPLLAV